MPLSLRAHEVLMFDAEWAEDAVGLCCVGGKWDDYNKHVGAALDLWLFRIHNQVCVHPSELSRRRWAMKNGRTKGYLSAKNCVMHKPGEGRPCNWADCRYVHENREWVTGGGK